MRVLLLAGGWSSEREVSLSGAKAIHKALESLGHEVVPFDPAHEFDQLFEKARACDFAFINLHGSPGEDGLIQAMLDSVKVPYQGSGPRASLLALNKAAAKHIFVDQGIATPPWEFLSGPPDKSWEPRIAFPVFAKPNMGGSSLGTSMVRERKDLDSALEAIFSTCGEALLEKMISGREVSCPVLGEEALPLILIRPLGGSEFFDYRAKYVPQMAEEICPAPLDTALAERIRETSLKAHRALGLKGYSRADFMVREDTPYLLEVNTLPGMTQTSLVPQSAAMAEYSFEDLIAKLLNLGMHEKRDSD
ncbi:MAG: D-alanine--D-alanine ligase [Thermodesulfobacteriota bacterium]|nr:D-alanine--D-alanine ligase [Thermodesulfobacteriota bacterium]